MILKVLAAGQSQLHSLRLSEGITLALRYVYKWKELENESWICHHLCNSIDKSFPTHWNATLALMAIDKTVHLQSILSIVSCSPAYCSHMLYITWIKKKKKCTVYTHAHTQSVRGQGQMLKFSFFISFLLPQVWKSNYHCSPQSFLSNLDAHVWQQ